MLALILGLAGFGLYLLYDINSFTRRSRLLHPAFAVGTGLIAAGTVLSFLDALRHGAFSGFADALGLLLGLLAFAALLYCLFFALPFTQTYAAPAPGAAARPPYTRRLYALCRHPGVLCFWAMELCWGLAALPSEFLRCGLLFSVLNTLYAWFQDRVTFPKTFSNYEAYRALAPFLIPNARSIRRAIQTWRNPSDKEVGL